MGAKVQNLLTQPALQEDRHLSNTQAPVSKADRQEQNPKLGVSGLIHSAIAAYAKLKNVNFLLEQLANCRYLQYFYLMFGIWNQFTWAYFFLRMLLARIEFVCGV